MKLASLIATSVAALIVAAALVSPASACRWEKRAGYSGAAADAGEARGYRSVRHHRAHRLYRPVRYWRHPRGAR